HEAADQGDALHLLLLVDAVPRRVLRRRELRELRLPVAQHVRLEVEHPADLADGEEGPAPRPAQAPGALRTPRPLRHRQLQCSALGVRSMRLSTDSRAEAPPYSTW